MQGKVDGDVQRVLMIHINFEGKNKSEDQIIAAIQPYQKITKQDITLQSKEGKYTAIITLSKSSANKICADKQITVGSKKVFVRKWFSDFQIFINKLNDNISQDDVKAYFKKFGNVLQVEITEAHHEIEDASKTINRHCYIKFQNEEDVEKCLFHPKHIIKPDSNNANEVKVVRAFNIGENEDSDKKLFIKIQPTVQNPQVFENILNRQFSKCGKLRERIRLEQLQQSNKATVIFTNVEGYSKALNTPSLQSIQGYTVIIRPFISKESSYRIFLSGIKPNITEGQIQSVIEPIFGKIVEISILPSKLPFKKNAVVTFTDEKSLKKALADYREYKEIQNLFLNQPYITIHMNARQRKEFIDFNSKTLSKQTMIPQNIYSDPRFQPFNINMNMNMNMHMNMNINQIPQYNNNMMMKPPQNIPQQFQGPTSIGKPI